MEDSGEEWSTAGVNGGLGVRVSGEGGEEESGVFLLDKLESFWELLESRGLEGSTEDSLDR